MKKISIILATYNWPESLDIILDNLSQQLKKNLNIEIIIADDGSKDATISVIKKHQARFSQIKHVWHEDIGFRKAKILNMAVAESTGDYLIFYNDNDQDFNQYFIDIKDYREQKLNQVIDG